APELAEWSDFLAVNAHPLFHNIQEPKRAVEWTVAAYQRLAEAFPAKPFIFKEVGLPTEGLEELSEQAQLEYYEALTHTPVKFAFFEAFDALFKNGPIERSWGVFRADRSPKPVLGVVRKRQLRGPGPAR